MFLNKMDIPYCLVVLFVVYPCLRPFWSVFGELTLFWCSAAFDTDEHNTVRKQESSKPPHVHTLGSDSLYYKHKRVNLVHLIESYLF